MKAKIFSLFVILALCLSSCEEPYQEEYELGLFVKNTSSRSFTAGIITGFYGGTNGTYNLNPGEEWHFTSIYYGDHIVRILDPVSMTLIDEISVWVPSADEKKAAVVEWDGANFRKYQK